MFAVVKTGAKQYRVASGDVIKVEKLDGEAGDSVTLDEVLMLGGDNPQIGAPTVAGASVTASIVEQARDKKVIVFKKRRRQNYRRKKGHRQHMTVLRIEDIKTGA
ncbi:50S ribosomal protein L21 [Parvularcula oceani]|uniref:50S ribosomal protein L21 n=1 Tax=Parvularcula oceani TaxID=1247963 RepID=UPI0004E14C7B|nr:50S ribosomal protein L21 [Parvularcula oceani]